MYEYRHRPTIKPYDMEDLHKLFDLGFAKVFFNSDCELVAAGPIELGFPFKTSGSIYWRERHVQVYARADVPDDYTEQQDCEMWSGYVPDEILDQGDPLVMAGYIREQAMVEMAIEKQVTE